MIASRLQEHIMKINLSLLPKRTQTKLSLVKYSTTLLLTIYTALFSLPNAQAQATNTTNNIGSSLGIVGQVVTNNNGNLDSTDAISSGDTVQWSNYFQSKLSSPYKSVGVMTLPQNFKWVKGSVRLPPRTTLEYEVNGSYVSAEPNTGTVVSRVRWTINPMLEINIQPQFPPLINFQGTGDGYRVIPYKNKFYVVNHHTGGTYLNCRNATDGSICEGFDIGKAIPATLGDPATTGIDLLFHTPNRSIEHLDQQTGNLYTFVSIALNSTKTNQSDAGKVYVRCVNLDTLKACANQTFMAQSNDPINAHGQYAVNPIGSVGSKYYAMMSAWHTKIDEGLIPTDARILCFDTAQNQPCAGQPYNPGWGGASDHSPSYIFGGRIYLAAGPSATKKSVLKCFNTLTNLPCSGWTKPDLEVRESLFPYLNRDGSFKGICTAFGGNVKCVDTAKNSFTPTTSYSTHILDSGFWLSDAVHGRTSNGTTAGNRLFLAKSVYWKDGIVGGPTGVKLKNINYANCFDFNTDSKCFELNTTDGSQPATYSIIKDPTRTDCMWSLGDAALAKSFNPKTGATCPSAPIFPPVLLLKVNPNDYYNCDGSKATITNWRAVRFSPALPWGAGGISSAKIRILDASDNLLPTQYNPIRNFTPGTYQIDISTIPFAQYPELTIELQVTAANSNVTATVGFDVTWDGEPIQLCFKTTAPNLDDCEVKVAVEQNNTPIHLPNAIPEELNVETKLIPGATDEGTGPSVTTTTLRQYPKGSSDPTQILQTRFDLKDFTGGLYQYELDNNGVISSQPTHSNQNLNIGTMFTSRFVTGSAFNMEKTRNPADNFQNFINLSPTQKSALNKDMNGNVDNKGNLRYAYMAGHRGEEIGNGGTFRTRASNRTIVFGPVINSSPVTLFPRSTAAYSEQQYPGYNLFKSSPQRTETMSFYQGNDGVLRAYEVKPSGLTAKFSFLPGSLLLGPASRYTDAKLSDLRKDPFLLDATPLISDAHLGDSKTEANKWRTVLIGNQGRGGSLVYALDITSGTLDKLLFEYTASSHTDFNSLGKVISPQPNDKVSGADQIVRLNNNRWAYIMGNGVKSATGKPVLYVFYLNAQSTSSASKWAAIPVPSPSNDPNDPIFSNNGLSTPRPVDVDNDGNIDLIYAGDIQGNLWRFKLPTNNSQLSTSNVTVKRLFKTANGEPIYTAPIVTSLPAADKLCKKDNNGVPDLKYCWMVSFGTGDLIDVLGQTTDKMTGTQSQSSATQSIYSIYDAGDDNLVTASQLVTKTFVPANNSTRFITTESVDYGPTASGVRGWRLELTNGERLTANPMLPSSSNLALFATGRPLGFPANGVCLPTQGWLTALDVGTGQSSDSLKDFTGTPASSLPINEPLLGNIEITPSASRTDDTSNISSRGSNIGGSNNTPTPIGITLPTIQGRISWREVFDLPK
jgi:hypothetical protein